MANLAILGGPRCVPENQTLPVRPWPPRNEETAEKLKELYLSGQWSFNSPKEQEFENAFARYHGAKYGVFMANGTTTLECSLAALGVGPGDEVIVPALTWMATALAAYYVGATPVIVDIDPATLCIDPAKIEAAITPKTKAIIPVHVYGSTADLEKILDIANRHGIPVIEDCAHMQGGFWNGRGVGSWGAVGSFSFQQSKTMASGEGGICITNDEKLAEKIYLLKHIGYVRGIKQGQAIRAPEGLICHNYRATAFQALILLEQLKELPQIIRTYGEHARLLTDMLQDVPGVRIQSPGRLADPQGYYSLHFIFDGEQFAGIDKKTINDACTAEGFSIGNGTHGPVYRHALFNLTPGQFRFAEGNSCPVCEKIFAKTLGVSHQVLTYRETVVKMGEIVRKVASNPDELRQYQAGQKS
ncbi:MAG: DegT/DnrJ/EryC1/StrS family aminotransferase [Lentisphaeria bacterium]|nr:DegT/DnrJ/EryC1/StrS family aminotransferase [Lentisphaeria bacterium]